MFNYLIQNPQEIFIKLIEHIELTTISVCIALSIGIPLGIFAAASKRLSRFILAIVNVIQTIPSLALFGLLIPLPFIGGIGATPAIVVLSLYALLPIVKNTYVGLVNVNENVIEAARGIGMTRLQRLWIVRFPAAFPVIMSGIRMSAVMTVGTVTIAAIIGAGGLGDFIYRGTSTMNYSLIMAGTIPAILLAIATDKFLEWIEKKIHISSIMKCIFLDFSPKKRTYLFIGMSFIPIITLFLVGRVSYQSNPDTIRIGVKNFTENRILGKILEKQLQHQLHVPIATSSLTTTYLLFQALSHGDVDMCAEYSGTVYSAILGREERILSHEVMETVRKAMLEKYDVLVVGPIGFQNSYTLAMREEDAEKYNIRTLSDLAQQSQHFIIGTTSECHDRYDGLKGLKQEYGFQFQKEKILEIGVRYEAIKHHQVDVIDACSTDGYLLSQNLRVLEDDRHFFPAYDGILLVRRSFAETHPAAMKLLYNWTNVFDDTVMQQMNYAADVTQDSLESISENFLNHHKLIAHGEDLPLL